MGEEGHSETPWEYARRYYTDPKVIADFELLSEYRSDVFDGYINLRRAAFADPPVGALAPGTKELIILAIECMARKTNPPPIFHARKAIESGATVAEVAEVVSICIMIGGMLSYQESGRFVLRAAKERAEELERDQVTG